MEVSRTTTFTAALLVLFVCSVSAQTTPEQLPLAAALETRTFVARMPVHLTADGQLIAYTVRTSFRFPTFTNFFAERGIPGEAFESQVRITRIADGETQELTPDTLNSWGPSWSPDGRHLAFYSDRDGYVHVWIWERDTRRIRRVTGDVARPSWNWETPRWTPDGRAVVVKLLPLGATVEEQDLRARGTSPEPVPGAEEATARVFGRATPDTAAAARVEGLPTWFPGAYGGDLAVIDMATGEVRRLASGLMPQWWEVSPDGAWVAFTHLAGIDALAAHPYSALAVVPISGGAVREIMRPLRQDWGQGVSWSPRTPILSFITQESEGAGLYLADARHGEPRRVADARPGWARPYHGPLWSPDGTAIWLANRDSLWRLDVADSRVRTVGTVPERSILDVLADRRQRVAISGNQHIIVRTLDREAGHQGFYRIHIRSGRVERMLEEPGSFGSSFTTDVAGESVVLMRSNARQPSDLWLATPDMRRVRKLSSLNPQLDGHTLGVPRLIEWTAPTGERRRGSLLLPPSRREGDHVPLIVHVYGGSDESEYLHNFQPQLQLLATRGYAVLMPDVPVRVGSPMEDIADGVKLAVDRAIALGIADSTRLGLLGHSYGGYSVLSVLVQSRQFGAAVASASQGNMFSMYGRMTPDGRPRVTWSERGQGGMGGTPWELRDRYVENSPYFFLDRVTTPLLLLHGGSDDNTPAYLAEETFTALRRLGRVVEYVRYEGENHTYRMWRMANQMDYWERIVGWFETYLRPSQ